MASPKNFQLAYLNDGSDVKIFNSIEKHGKFFSVILSAECDVGEGAIAKTIGSNMLIAKTRHYAKNLADAASSTVINELEERFESEKRIIMRLLDRRLQVSCPIIIGRHCHVSPITSAFNVIIKESPILSERYFVSHVKAGDLRTIPEASQAQKDSLSLFLKFVSA